MPQIPAIPARKLITPTIMFILYKCYFSAFPPFIFIFTQNLKRLFYIDSRLHFFNKRPSFSKKHPMKCHWIADIFTPPKYLCSSIKYSRIIHIYFSNTLRLFNIPPKETKHRKKEFNVKISMKCPNKHEKEIYIIRRRQAPLS